MSGIAASVGLALQDFPRGTVAGYLHIDLIDVYGQIIAAKNVDVGGVVVFDDVPPGTYTVNASRWDEFKSWLSGPVSSAPIVVPAPPVQDVVAAEPLAQDGVTATPLAAVSIAVPVSIAVALV